MLKGLQDMFMIILVVMAAILKKQLTFSFCFPLYDHFHKRSKQTMLKKEC